MNLHSRILPVLCLIALASTLSAAVHDITKYVSGGSSISFRNIQVAQDDRVNVHVKPKVCWKITEDAIADLDTVGWQRLGKGEYTLAPDRINAIDDSKKHSVRFYGKVERTPCSQGGDGGEESEYPTDWEVKGSVQRLGGIRSGVKCAEGMMNRVD